MLDRDEQILRHIGLYRLSLRAVLDVVFFDGKTSDHVVQRLLGEQRIRSFQGLPDGLSYYQLSLIEARRLGFPDDRTRPHKPAALSRALAVLWFCCMTGKKRRRIERRQLSKLLGPKAPGFGLPHSIELFDDGKNVVRRIYTPGSGARVSSFVKKLRREAAHALTSPTLAKWAAAETYTFAVLCESEERRARFEVILGREPALPIPFHVERVPSPLSLAKAIRVISRERS